jgi:hypothetical protein
MSRDLRERGNGGGRNLHKQSRGKVTRSWITRRRFGDAVNVSGRRFDDRRGSASSVLSHGRKTHLFGCCLTQALVVAAARDASLIFGTRDLSNRENHSGATVACH